MYDRFYCSRPISDRSGDVADAVGACITLDGSEAHHLAHVMRAKPGARVVLFDGSGAEFTAEVLRVGRSHVELTIVDGRNVDRELDFDLTLAVALPKGERQSWLVEKGVELGVTRIVPLIAARSVAQPIDKALDRLRRTVVEASKQCGRNRRMEIEAPRRWAEFAAESSPSACRMVAHPGGGAPPASRGIRELRDLIAAADRVMAAIGPEGGFTDEEIAAAVAAGWTPVDLGPRILRVETAALFAAATVLASR
jgi:16S rRNA (uracil1498-N3)-methyltransferase